MSHASSRPAGKAQARIFFMVFTPFRGGRRASGCPGGSEPVRVRNAAARLSRGVSGGGATWRYTDVLGGRSSAEGDRIEAVAVHPTLDLGARLAHRVRGFRHVPVVRLQLRDEVVVELALLFVERPFARPLR